MSGVTFNLPAKTETINPTQKPVTQSEFYFPERESILRSVSQMKEMPALQRKEVQVDKAYTELVMYVYERKNMLDNVYREDGENKNLLDQDVDKLPVLSEDRIYELKQALGRRTQTIRIGLISQKLAHKIVEAESNLKSDLSDKNAVTQEIDPYEFEGILRKKPPEPQDIEDSLKTIAQQLARLDSLGVDLEQLKSELGLDFTISTTQTPNSETAKASGPSGEASSLPEPQSGDLSAPNLNSPL